MAQNFLPCDRDQSLLLAPDLRDWLPEDHLAWFVIDAVGELDLAAFFADYRADGHGRAAHDPEMMVALLIYSYATGERSSRRIERRCREDIAHRVICANQAPDHATIARFRSRHEDALAGLFTEVLKLCVEGRADLGRDDRLRRHPDRRRRRRSPEQDLPPARQGDPRGGRSCRRRRGREVRRGTRRRAAARSFGAAKGRLERLREAKRQLDEEHEAKLEEMAAWQRAKADYAERTGSKDRRADEAAADRRRA